MKHRVFKKKQRIFLEWFSKDKIPLAFKSKRERKQWVNDIMKKYNIHPTDH